jgi:hypothetical protein
VVFSKAHVHSRMKRGPTLTNEDISGADNFTGIAFYAKPFRL